MLTGMNMGLGYGVPAVRATTLGWVVGGKRRVDVDLPRKTGGKWGPPVKGLTVRVVSEGGVR